MKENENFNGLGYESNNSNAGVVSYQYQSVDNSNTQFGSDNIVNNDVISDIQNLNTVNVQNSAPVYEEVMIKEDYNVGRTDSYFDGKLLELIGWTLLKNLITIVTLGIANPWGECMLMRYQIEHTVLNGKRLKFVGSGGSLFVEKFKWFFFTLITLGLYAFVIPVRRYRWIFSNIHFEDEMFIRNESFFDGKTIQLIGVNILCGLLNILSFGILYAFTYCFKLRWVSKHAVINRKKIVFNGKSLNLFGKYLLWGFLTVITFGIFALWIGIKLSKWETKNTHIKVTDESYQEDYTLLWLLAILVALLSIFIVFIATFDINVIKNSEFLESIFSNITIGGPEGFIVIGSPSNY